jgi:hypothetical protein
MRSPMATISKYQTASGATLYRVRYRTLDHRATQKRGFKTKRDAEQFAATVEVDKLRGEYVAPSVGKTTVGELGPAWLERPRHEAVGVQGLQLVVAYTRSAALGRSAHRLCAPLQRAALGVRAVHRAQRLHCGARTLGAGPGPRRRGARPHARGQPGARDEAAEAATAPQHLLGRRTVAAPSRRVRSLSLIGAAARRRRAALGRGRRATPVRYRLPAPPR